MSEINNKQLDNIKAIGFIGGFVGGIDIEGFLKYVDENPDIFNSERDSFKGIKEMAKSLLCFKKVAASALAVAEKEIGFTIQQDGSLKPIGQEQ